MTLCMAARCVDGNRRLIVTTADQRAEKDWAGGEVGWKFGWAARPGWGALLAGEIGKAEDFLATSRELLNPEEFTSRNIFDKLNEVSCAHKKKLIERHVQMRLGISFERFLTEGEHELTSQVRNQMMYEIERLDFGCSLILFGYIQHEPFMFSIDSEGEVTFCQNFSAIGTGAVIAEATLYQRGQSAFNSSLDQTLYNLYEASEMARIAPGVSKTRHFAVFEPSETEDEKVTLNVLSDECLDTLGELFNQYGSKRIDEIPPLSLKYIGFILPSDTIGLWREKKVAEWRAATKKRGRKSKPKKSKGQP